MNGKKGLIAALVAALLLGGVALGGVVLAQSPSPAPGGGTVQAPQRGNSAAVRSRIDDFLNTLAQNLHIDRPTLDNALKTTAKQEVDQAVAAGRITQEQGDKIKQRIDSGQFPIRPGAFGRAPGNRPEAAAQCRANLRDSVATALGISPSDLQQARSNGETIAQIAQEHGKSVADLRTAVADAVRGCLDQAVQSGQLTQQQEQNILRRLQDSVSSQTVPGGGGIRNRHGTSGAGSQ